MSEKANPFRIGLFVTIGVAIILGGLFVFGIRSAFQPTFTFETYVTGDVQGLSVGSAVKLRGVEIGKVTEIGFSWNLYEVAQPACVVVRCAVKQRITPEMFWKGNVRAELEKIVSRGLRAIVQGEGITGSSIIALQTMDPEKYPALPVPWTPKYPYIPSAPSQLGRLLASVDRTLANLEKFEFGSLSQNLNRVLDTANAALQKVSELDVQGISGGAKQALRDADAAILEVKGAAEDARQEVRSMKLAAVGGDARQLLRNLDVRLTALIDKLSAIDVRSLNDTLAGTREAARNLNDALSELKKYPSGFFFGQAPPPARVPKKEEK